MESAEKTYCLPSLREAIEESENNDAEHAAKVNQKYGFSEIIWTKHRENVHFIAECMIEDGWYRLKTITYQYFGSEKEMRKYCDEHKNDQKQLPDITPKNKIKRMEAKRLQGRRATTGLNERQKIFCEEFLQSRNATRAYMIAYPNVKNAQSASANANKLRRRPAVKAYLEAHIPTTETLKKAQKH